MDFLLETIRTNKNDNAFFLIIGDGTEFNMVDKWFVEYRPRNATLLRKLPKTDYDTLLASCDVGLIFLNKNFLIPNFPSRLLSYLEMKMPVIAATDPNTDIGDVIEAAQCGYKVIAGDIDDMNYRIDLLANQNDLSSLQSNAWNLLNQEYLTERSYKLIIGKL